MAKTQYSYSQEAVSDAGTVTDPTAELGGSSNQAVGRYSGFTGTYSYPESNVVDGYYVPMMTFKFHDAFGSSISASPTIKLRVPPNFNVTHVSEYARQDNIFDKNMQREAAAIYGGATAEKVASQEGQISASDLTSGADLLQYGATAAEAFLYSLEKSLQSVKGFVASGGLNGLAQAEFLGRAMVNPYAQLLYKGPQFRRYTVPILIRPRTKKEAENAVKIIKAFKIAASPSAQGRRFTVNNTVVNLQSFTFGYPHLTKFDITFSSPEVSKTIFQSELCAIENIAVDYGGQKMAFFEDGNPTEISLNLQLTEVRVRTLNDAKNDSIATRTIV